MAGKLLPRAVREWCAGGQDKGALPFGAEVIEIPTC